MNEWSSWVIWSQLGIWAGLKLPEIGDRSPRWHSLCSKILTSAPTIEGCVWALFSGHSLNKKTIYPHDVEEVGVVLRPPLQPPPDPIKEPGRRSVCHLTQILTNSDLSASSRFGLDPTPLTLSSSMLLSVRATALSDILPRQCQAGQL